MFRKHVLHALYVSVKHEAASGTHPTVSASTRALALAVADAAGADTQAQKQTHACTHTHSQETRRAIARAGHCALRFIGRTISPGDATPNGGDNQLHVELKQKQTHAHAHTHMHKQGTTF